MAKLARCSTCLGYSLLTANDRYGISYIACSAIISPNSYKAMPLTLHWRGGKAVTERWRRSSPLADKDAAQAALLADDLDIRT